VPLFYDRHVNGDRGAKAVAVQTITENTARDDLKPSRLGQPGAFPFVRLRSRGVAFHEIFLPPYNWLAIIAASSAGTYGYMTIRSPTLYYLALGLVYLGIVFLLLLIALRSPDRSVAVRLGTAGIFAFGIVLLAALHSWVLDFQAQGRYLFPIAAMLGIALRSASAELRVRVFGGFVAAAFVLSMYSFVFVGLKQIEKTF
jgi:hypothetical protein